MRVRRQWGGRGTTAKRTLELRGRDAEDDRFDEHEKAEAAARVQARLLSGKKDAQEEDPSAVLIQRPDSNGEDTGARPANDS